MPQPFNNAIMTDSGAALLTRVQAGKCKMEFTRIAIGDGAYKDADKAPGVLQKQKSLKSLRNTFEISDMNINNIYSVKMTAVITNQDPVTKESLVTEGYFINEMGLFAREIGKQETEILYSIAVTSGINGDFMPPYNGFCPVQIIQEYYATVNNSAEIKIQVDNGTVASAKDLTEVKENVQKLADDNKELYQKIQELSATSVLQTDVTIPVSGWKEDTDTGGAYTLCADITAEGIAEEMIPMLTILPECQQTAADCGLCTTTRTIEGALRVYAKEAPEAEIKGSLALLCGGGVAGGTGGSYTLPAATKDRLGGVKIGDHINVKGDGTISVDGEALIEDVTATDADVTEMLNDVFGNKTEGSN